MTITMGMYTRCIHVLLCGPWPPSLDRSICASQLPILYRVYLVFTLCCSQLSTECFSTLDSQCISIKAGRFYYVLFKKMVGTSFFILPLLEMTNLTFVILVDFTYTDQVCHCLQLQLCIQCWVVSIELRVNISVSNYINCELHVSINSTIFVTAWSL